MSYLTSHGCPSLLAYSKYGFTGVVVQQQSPMSSMLGLMRPQGPVTFDPTYPYNPQDHTLQFFDGGALLQSVELKLYGFMYVTIILTDTNGKTYTYYFSSVDGSLTQVLTTQIDPNAYKVSPPAGSPSDVYMTTFVMYNANYYNTSYTGISGTNNGTSTYWEFSSPTITCTWAAPNTTPVYVIYNSTTPFSKLFASGLYNGVCAVQIQGGSNWFPISGYSSIITSALNSQVLGAADNISPLTGVSCSMSYTTGATRTNNVTYTATWGDNSTSSLTYLSNADFTQNPCTPMYGNAVTQLNGPVSFDGTTYTIATVYLPNDHSFDFIDPKFVHPNLLPGTTVTTTGIVTTGTSGTSGTGTSGTGTSGTGTSGTGTSGTGTSGTGTSGTGTSGTGTSGTGTSGTGTAGTGTSGTGTSGTHATSTTTTVSSGLSTTTILLISGGALVAVVVGGVIIWQIRKRRHKETTHNEVVEESL